MTDFQIDSTNEVLLKAIDSLNIKFPVSALVDRMGYSKSVVSKYLQKDAKPSGAFLEQFEKSFNIKLSDFSSPQPKTNQTGDMTVNEPFEHYFTENKNGNKFEKLDDTRWVITVPMIPIKAHARYISEYTDGEEIEGYPFATFIVDQFGKGNYIGIEVTNDSMDDGSISGTPSRATALGRELGRQYWKDGFRPSDYGWAIVTKQGIIFKDITNLNSETMEITCHSRNDSPEYGDFKLSLNDVMQIFKIIKRQF